MRKRTQLIAPALVAGILLLGAAGLAARPAASPAPPASRVTAAPPAASPVLLAAAGSEATIDLPVAPAAPSPTPTPTAESAPATEPPPTAAPTYTPLPAPSATPQPTEVSRPTPTSQPLPPVRIVAPAIGLDAKVVTVGWHEVADANGSTHTEWDVASYAAGWHKNSARPGQVGNVVLSGHNNIEGEVFRNLERFQEGDQITLYAGDRSFTYLVSDKFTLPDKGVPYDERVKNAQWIGAFPDERLTLVSCWPPTNNTHRIFIIARPAK